MELGIASRLASLPVAAISNGKVLAKRKNPKSKWVVSSWAGHLS
jgi:hypothetical protein